MAGLALSLGKLRQLLLTVPAGEAQWAQVLDTADILSFFFVPVDAFGGFGSVLDRGGVSGCGACRGFRGKDEYLLGALDQRNDGYVITLTRARNLDEALAVLALHSDPDVRRAAARRVREKM